MANMKLTAPAVAKLRASKNGRREIADAGCVGLYLIIQESGAKSWACRFRRPNGKAAKLTLGTCDVTGQESNGEPVIGSHLTLASARRLAAEVRRQVALGNDPANDYLAEKSRRRAVAVEAAANTFGAAVRQFIDEYEIPSKGRKPRNWDETAKLLGLDINARDEKGNPTETKGGLCERWRDKPLADIDAHDIYQVIHDAKTRGHPGLGVHNTGASNARARKQRGALSSMFTWLVQHRRIASNPCAGVWQPPSPKKRDRVLNSKIDTRRADEVRWFWSACDQISEPFGALFKVLLLTGCRRDEIAEMRWDELSDDKSMLRLPGDRTKNSLPHHVPLSPMARDILAGVKRIEGCAYVFTTTGKTPVSGFSKMKKALDEAMLAEARKERGKDAAIEPFTLHDLRRTASTSMAGIKVEPHVIEACLNHISGFRAGVAGTYNVEQYADEKKAALEAWARHVKAIISDNVVPMKKVRS